MDKPLEIYSFHKTIQTIHSRRSANGLDNFQPA